MKHIQTETLTSVVDGLAELNRGQRKHLASCQQCQYELDAFEEIAASLKGLKLDLVEPPSGAIEDLLVAIAVRQRSFRVIANARKAAYAGGIAVAAAAGITGAVLLGRQKGPFRKAA